MSHSDRDRWNAKYKIQSPLVAIKPDDFLVEAFDTVQSMTDPPTSNGKDDLCAIDLACGLGGNAIWLAQQNWRVTGLDISKSGLQLADAAANGLGSQLEWIEADLDIWSPSRPAFQLITCFRFLDRESIPRVVRQSLMNHGFLIYETFARAQIDRPDSHIKNPEYTLREDEILTLFQGFEPLIYRTDELIDRTVVRFLGQLQDPMG